MSENISNFRIRAAITALILAIAMISAVMPTQVFAEETYDDGSIVFARYYDNNLEINSQSIPAGSLTDPLIISGGYIYIPMDATFGSLLGIKAELDSSEESVHITSDSAQAVDFTGAQSYGWSGTVKMLEVKNLSATFTASDGTQVSLDMSSCPALYNGTTVYVPISPILQSGAAGWTADYTNENGLILTTSSAAAGDSSSYSPSSSQLSAEKLSSLVSYILRENSSVSESDAETMVNAFYNYGNQYGIDPLLLMATAQCESTFDKSEPNDYGCIGLMQISRTTGAEYGFTAEDLSQIDPSVHAAAAIMAGNFSSYGDSERSISAYCYGKGNVNRGNYKLGYYNNIMKKYSAISSLIV